MEKVDIDITIEILILGQTAVGKTNLLSRYVSDRFFESSRPTIGNDYFKIQRTFNGMKTFVKFWDTAGQERFNAMTNTFYHNADAVVLVYDISNRDSFERISHWFAEVRINCKKQVRVMLIGNKNDLVDEREVPIEEAVRYAKQNDMLFFETSAKTNEDKCVTKAFQTLIEERVNAIADDMAKQRGMDLETFRKSVTQIQDKKVEKKSGCC